MLRVRPLNHLTAAPFFYAANAGMIGPRLLSAFFACFVAVFFSSSTYWPYSVVCTKKVFDRRQFVTKPTLAAVTSIGSAVINVRVHFRLALFKSSLQGVFAAQHVQSLQVETVTVALHSDYPEAKFTKGEIDACLDRMQDDNQVMVSDQQVFLI